MAKEKLLFVGNCQKTLIARMAEILALDADVQVVHSSHIIKFGAKEYRSLLDDADVVFTQPLIGEKFEFFQDSDVSASHRKVIKFPSLSFNGYHPDCVYLGSGKYKSPIGDYHSSIAALAFNFKYSTDDAIRLYCNEVYEGIGYYSLFESEVARLSNSLKRFGIEISRDIGELMASSRMMHTINHPTAQLLSLFTTALLKKAGVPCRDTDADHYVVDTFPESTVFPVFPEVAARLGLRGGYVFKADLKAASNGRQFYELTDFVEGSMAKYAGMGEEVLANPRFTPKYVEMAKNIFERVLEKQAKVEKPARRHPYAGLPSYQNWMKSFKNVQAQDVDLAVDCFPFIKPSDKIATAGSCFAQHIAKSLSSSGYNYFIAESPAVPMSRAEAFNNGYGVFSARYGNVYTAKQLLQLFDRAFDAFDPILPDWFRDDGRVVDPFRPQVAAEGFADNGEMLSDRKRHLLSVKRMFKELDIFIFTLGLTEAWRHKSTGAILPIAPGVVAGTMSEDEYEPVNFRYDEVYSDMAEFLDKLKAVNPRAEVLLTVSPVPLMATFEPRHVLVSTTVSKSILRSAADQLVRRYGFTHYFPSYEIITGNYTRGEYFAEDLREVKPEGVSHVMTTFLKHCVHPITKSIEARDELEQLDQIICDEEALNV
ncbi:GSCFA domain-containing protein [Shinella sp. BYT-45]|uniref:GSCFA domain-containing protein n=1 Tax=Shinella sp. BYT-45 TaxID=3377377 RepID=UPI00397FAF5E